MKQHVRKPAYLCALALGVATMLRAAPVAAGDVDAAGAWPGGTLGQETTSVSAAEVLADGAGRSSFWSTTGKDPEQMVGSAWTCIYCLPGSAADPLPGLGGVAAYDPSSVLVSSVIQAQRNQAAAPSVQ